MPTDLIYFIARIALGTVAIWASAAKAVDPLAFVRGVRRYELLPRRFALLAAAGIIAGEAAVGTLVLLDVAVPYAAAAGAVLFGLFAVAIAIDLKRGVRVPCHCFGAADTETLSFVSFTRASLFAITSATVSAAASTGVPPLGSEKLIPALTLVAAVVITTRLIGLVPGTLQTFAAKPIVASTRRHRTKMHAWPLELGLRIVAPPPPASPTAEGARSPALTSTAGGIG